MGFEDKFIEERFGRKSPFKVPDGYFESFASQVMDKLPEGECPVVPLRPTFWKRHRYSFIAAASFIVALFSIGIYLGSPYSGVGQLCDNAVPAGVQVQNVDNAMDYVADYTMMDNDDIYALVSDY